MLRICFSPTRALSLTSPFLLSAFVCFTSFAAAGAEGNWPEFRGPAGDGHAGNPGLPVQWSETENVVWKTPIPFEGWSTPVAMDGQIWLTTATPDGHEYFALGIDADTGEIRFNENLFHCDTPDPLGNAVNCYASPTPAIEKGRVYVHFGSYGTACLDTATGKTIWKRTDLPCRHYRGPGSSVFLFENLLILTFDGADQQYVAALDKNTGETVWRTDRSTAWTDLDEQGKPKRDGDLRKAFSTPIVVDVAGKLLLISPASSATFAYDPRTGQEIWKLHHIGYSTAVRPVYGDGLVYFTTGRGGKVELLAVRPEGQGEISGTNIAWKLEAPVIPTEPSPLFVDGLLYLLSNNGAITCIEAATGTQLWSERIGGNYLASPLYADGRIFLCSTQGKSTVIRAGRAYSLEGTSTLDAGFMASPAVMGKALYLRTKTHLYRVESRP